MKRNKIVITIILVLLVFSSSYNIASSKITNSSNILKNANSWAVFITVGDPKRDLKNVNDLKKILLDNGWDENNIYILSEHKATKKTILEMPQLLVNYGLKKDDLVLFYFSMHGGRTDDVEPFDEPDGVDEFIIPFKNDKGNSSDYILDDELASAFDCINSKNILLIFETCYSGGMIDGSSDLRKSGRVIITSADADETSYPLFLKRSWLFPFYFIKGLKGPADANKDNIISAEETFSYAEKRTIIRSSIYGSLFYIFHRSLFIQHPQIYDGWPNEENNQDELELIYLKTR